jgi:hypothetical protein
LYVLVCVLLDSNIEWDVECAKEHVICGFIITLTLKY